MHRYNPLRWFNSILKLPVVLVFTFREPSEVKMVDCVHIHLGHDVRVEHRLRCHCEIGNHLFRIEDHLVWVSHNRFILDVLAILILGLCPFHDFYYSMELLQGKLCHMRVYVGHHSWVIWLQCIVELLLNLSRDTGKLVDKAETVVEV